MINYGGSTNLPAKDEAEAKNNPYKFLSISLTCDASLLLTGSQDFWNNFIFKFSEYGVRLLGLNTERLNDGYLVYTNNDAQTNFYDPDANDQILVGGNTQDITADATTSIFQSDLRVKVSVDSHLSTASNLIVLDEVETVSRDIVEAYFLNDISVETEWDENGEFQGINIKTNVYSGQKAFIKKSDRHSNWTKLLSAENLQFFRFHLKITYRVFDTTSLKYKLVTSKLSVPEDFYWLFVIKFVSDE